VSRSLVVGDSDITPTNLWRTQSGDHAPLIVTLTPHTPADADPTRRSAVERILRQQRVDGHEVTVVEVMEDEGPSFLLVADEVVVNSDAPTGPTHGS
jgi:hypothetical protein